MSMTAVVIGYGNVVRGDDGVGPLVAEAVAARRLPGVCALAVPQLTPELAEVLAGADLAVFVDAGVTPEGGGAHVLPVGPAPRPESLGHTRDPGVLLALAREVFGRFPRAWIVRVPAVTFRFGAGLSTSVSRGAAAALREVVRLVGPADPQRVDVGAESSAAAVLDRVDCT